jgi:hypothetical protein
MLRVTPTRTESWTEFAEVSSTIRWTDILVYALILGFGALEFFCCAQAPDFSYDDFFADAGRSLVEHGFYGINGYSETNQPPGLPWILGMLCMAGACSHSRNASPTSAPQAASAERITARSSQLKGPTSIILHVLRYATLITLDLLLDFACSACAQALLVPQVRAI